MFIGEKVTLCGEHTNYPAKKFSIHVSTYFTTLLPSVFCSSSDKGTVHLANLMTMSAFLYPDNHNTPTSLLTSFFLTSTRDKYGSTPLCCIAFGIVVISVFYFHLHRGYTKHKRVFKLNSFCFSNFHLILLSKQRIV